MCGRDPATTAPWALQTMFATIDADDWVYRRAPGVRVPLTVATRRTADGVPYLAPELALLFKAPNPRPKDEADFDAVRPLLDAEAKDRLARALSVAHPEHPWIGRLT